MVYVAGRDDVIFITCAVLSQAVILLPESRPRPLLSWSLLSQQNLFDAIQDPIVKDNQSSSTKSGLNF